MRAIATAFLIGLAALPAAAADLGRSGDRAGEAVAGLPACDDPGVLKEIVRRQHRAEADTWKNGVRIEAIRDIRQSGRVYTAPSAIAHRHCRAVADVGTARAEALIYVISDGLGFASVGRGVDFCMPSYDPWRVYGGGCRVLR